jgi:hypothetical protein
MTDLTKQQKRDWTTACNALKRLLKDETLTLLDADGTLMLVRDYEVGMGRCEDSTCTENWLDGPFVSYSMDEVLIREKNNGDQT